MMVRLCCDTVRKGSSVLSHGRGRWFEPSCAHHNPYNNYLVTTLLIGSEGPDSAYVK